MANSNKPSVNTHQSIIIAPNGGPIYGRDRQEFRYYNNYPVVQKQLGQDPTYYVRRRPAIENLSSTITNHPTANAITSAFFDTDTQNLWFVNARDVCYLNPSDPAVEDLNRMQADPALSEIVLFKAGADEFIIVADIAMNVDTKIHLYNRLTSAWSSTATFNIRATSMVFLDGYLFFSANASSEEQRIYNTTLGDPEELLETVSFIDAEMHGDKIICLEKHHNHIVAFGSKSIEFFYNSSNEIGSPLSRQASYSTAIGMYDIGNDSSTESGWAKCAVDDDIYFVGASNANNTGLYRLRKFQAQKIGNAVLDNKLREIIRPKLSPFDLNGEICVLIMDGLQVVNPMLYIPSIDTAVEFGYTIKPTRSIVVSSNVGSHNTVLFETDADTDGATPPTPIWVSGTHSFWDDSFLSESFTSYYWTDYLDFNNNARKHWKHVDALGSFGTNLVGLGYYKDSFGLDNAEIINLPYVNASDVGALNNIRFRNLGMSRRISLVLFISGDDDYLYKGLSIGYNQWGD